LTSCKCPAWPPPGPATNPSLPVLSQWAVLSVHAVPPPDSFLPLLLYLIGIRMVTVTWISITLTHDTLDRPYPNVAHQNSGETSHLWHFRNSTRFWYTSKMEKHS
jgi:hypothetical protein